MPDNDCGNVEQTTLSHTNDDSEYELAPLYIEPMEIDLNGGIGYPAQEWIKAILL